MTDRNEPSQEMDDQARLRAVLDSAVDGIITIDENGTIEAANPAAEQLFGYATSEMIGHNVKMLMPSPYHEEHDGYLANYQRSGERKIIGIGREVRGRRSDGSSFPLYLAVSEVSLGHRRVFTGFVHDLTDLRSVEQQATQLGRILEESQNEIFIFDAETLQFLLSNRGAQENLGYSTDEMSRMTPVDIKPEYTNEKFRKLIAPLSSGAESVLQFETLHQRRDKSLYDVHVRLQKATWKERDAFVATILDITERKRAQNELAQLNVRLEERVEQRTAELGEAQEQLVRKEKLATLGQLAGGVAHEIRNPLGVIKNSVYYLKMFAEKLDADGRACVEDIDREVGTANRIVSELLDFTRDPTTHIEEFHLKESISAAIRASQVPATVQLELHDVGTEHLVKADRGQIERILINLIRNACQAMSDRGQLTISVETDVDRAVIHVQDDGVGIRPEDRLNVFEPLFTTKAKGIGLGLAVSQRYAQSNGGSLTVESTLNEGTTFHLSLPLERSADE